MTTRPSMWSQVMMARYLDDAVCPECREMNTRTRKHMIDVNELGAAECAKCGAEWQAPRYVATAVNE